MKTISTASRIALIALCAATVTACSAPRKDPPKPLVVPSETQVKQGTAQPVAFPIKP